MTNKLSKIGHVGLWWRGPASTPGVGYLMVESGYVPLSIGFAQGPSSPSSKLMSVGPPKTLENVVFSSFPWFPWKSPKTPTKRV